HVPKVGELTQSEMVDFHQLFRCLESSLERSFGADLVNLSCERNWAFRSSNPIPPFLDGKPNPHVHWHIVPRYRKPVHFMGARWDDPTFGEPFVWKEKAIEEDITLGIIQILRRGLPVTYKRLPNCCSLGENRKKEKGS